jgi:peptidoglycan/xylan/chitin deacetylase (PgdA/CDA1 family)
MNVMATSDLIHLLVGFAAVSLVYMFIPNFYARHLSKHVSRKLTINNENKTIALTFDDGPHEQHTTSVLDLLSKYDVKATFFLVASNARQNRNIVMRMKREGHCIAMHSLNHKCAWLSFPWETRSDFMKSLKILGDLGIQVKYFRPPWGIFNAVTLACASKHDLRTVLWSVEAYDWRKNNTPHNIERILLERTKHRDIIVLHDRGGREETPLNTIRALKTAIPSFLAKGYQFVTLDDGMEKEH